MARLVGEHVYGPEEAAKRAGLINRGNLKERRRVDKLDGIKTSSPAYYIAASNLYLYRHSHILEFCEFKQEVRREKQTTLGEQPWPKEPLPVQKPISASQGEFGVILYRWQVEELDRRRAAVIKHGLELDEGFMAELMAAAAMDKERLAAQAAGIAVEANRLVEPTPGVLAAVADAWSLVMWQEKQFRRGFDLDRSAEAMISDWRPSRR